MPSFTLSIHRSLGRPLFLFPSNLACSALCGIRSIVILSTCPNHPSLRWTTLSCRVVYLPKACPMSAFFYFVYPCNFCDPPKPTNFCCKDPFLILFSHCPTFQTVQENRLYHRFIYFNLDFLC